MRCVVQRRLLGLNKRFYRKVASNFHETRGRPWPGFETAADLAKSLRSAPWDLLDAGCGNARLLVYLAKRGLVRSYTGVDAEPALLEKAETAARRPYVETMKCTFLERDIARADWTEGLDVDAGFDAIWCLAVLHHLPGENLRAAALRQLATLLDRRGVIVLSVWQPLNSERERRKIADWSEVGMQRRDVQEGDLLIRWKRGEEALRYVHVVDKKELDRLAQAAGLVVRHSFLQDGPDLNLNLYGILHAGP